MNCVCESVGVRRMRFSSLLFVSYVYVCTVNIFFLFFGSSVGNFYYHPLQKNFLVVGGGEREKEKKAGYRVCDKNFCHVAVFSFFKNLKKKHK